MSLPKYVALTTEGGHVRFETVGRAIAWVAENGGHVYEKLGLTTAQQVCAEGLDPAAVACVVEAARDGLLWLERRHRGASVGSEEAIATWRLRSALAALGQKPDTKEEHGTPDATP